jgi:predicted DsbA family dithiol-disulfide isomerase
VPCDNNNRSDSPFFIYLFLFICESINNAMATTTAAGTALKEVHVRVISDILCPWCYVGKKSLERAAAELKAEGAPLKLIVHYVPFQLDPTIPEAGMPYMAYMAKRFGPQAAEMLRTHGPRLKQRAAGLGFEMNMDRIERIFNSARPQQLLVALDADPQRQMLLAEELLRLHWAEGVDLGVEENLLAAAERVGAMTRAEAAAALADEATVAKFREAKRAAQQVADSVPTFLFEKTPQPVSGGQEVTVFKQLLARELAA